MGNPTKGFPILLRQIVRGSYSPHPRHFRTNRPQYGEFAGAFFRTFRENRRSIRKSLQKSAILLDKFLKL